MKPHQEITVCMRRQVVAPVHFSRRNLFNSSSLTDVLLL